MDRLNAPTRIHALRAALLHVFRATVLLAATYQLATSLTIRTPSANDLALLVALFVISLLDIGLAQGDTADVDAALLVAGIYLYGAPTMLLMCTVVRVMVLILLPRGRGVVDSLDSLLKRYAGILVCALVLDSIIAVRVSPGLEAYLHVAILGVVFAVVQLISTQLGRARDRGDSVFRLFIGNLILQGPLLAAGISVAILLVIVIEDMGPWGVALTLLLLITMRQSFSLLLDIRASYQSTIEALVGAMEAQRTDGRGTGDRTAALARAAAAEIGWFGARVERIGYATLLHYYGLTLNAGTGDEVVHSRNPLMEVEFLRPVRPMLAPLNGARDSRVEKVDVRAAYIVGLSIEQYSPGRSRDRIRDLEESLSPRWLTKARRAVNIAREKQ